MHNTRVIRTISAGYALLVRVASSLQSPFLLVVRLYWGWQFMQTGWGKFHNLARVAQFFTSLGIPFPHANAVLVASIEFFGGALLIIGLGSRIVGLVLSFNMLVAYHSRPRSFELDLFQSWQVLWRRSLHVPVCGIAGADLRCRFVFYGPPHRTFHV